MAKDVLERAGAISNDAPELSNPVPTDTSAEKKVHHQPKNSIIQQESYEDKSKRAVI
jgi:hypothetical protein